MLVQWGADPDFEQRNSGSDSQPGPQGAPWQDWRADMPDDEVLRRLLALNLERSQATPR